MLLFLIIFLAFFVRTLLLNQSFWLDEAAQVIESARPLSQQLKIAGDFQPPLYHVLLHFWMQLGTSEAWIRSLSVLFAIGTIIYTYKIASKIFNRKIALTSVLLLSIAPFSVWYAQEARPYALAVFLATAATYYLLTKNAGGYFLSALGFVYSIYLAPFLLIVHGVFILRERVWFKKWLSAISLVGLFFLPWLPSFFEQLSIGSGLQYTLPGWSEAVSAPLAKALPLTFVKFAIGRISFANDFLYGAIALLLFTVFGSAIWSAWKNMPRKTFTLLLFFLGPLLLSFITSIFLPILAPQRVLFLLPYFYMLLATGIVTARKFQWLLILPFIIISTYAIFLYQTNPEFQKEQWRQATDFVKLNSNMQSKTIFVFPDAFAPWQWYTNGSKEYLAVAPTFTVKDNELLLYKTSLSQSDRLFYFSYLTDLTDPQKKVVAFIHDLGFVSTDVKNFPGVGFVTIYEKHIASY
ncbi:hypothetical protein C4564_00825 [Candidatus Microgenomates bacterium]|nr:MAG: hypothetical protein C4564_00825 [Candidatus Microgenomates bacterium]